MSENEGYHINFRTLEKKGQGECEDKSIKHN